MSTEDAVVLAALDDISEQYEVYVRLSRLTELPSWDEVEDAAPPRFDLPLTLCLDHRTF
jgi:hypothetical protein